MLVQHDNSDDGLPLGAPPSRPNLMSVVATPELGPRHQLAYQEWLGILQQEAQSIAERAPDNLSILAGDSISLWFPPEILPPEQQWLNQGISGETSSGLLARLYLFDDTRPDQIFVMIGINDLIQGIDADIVLKQHQAIIQDLKQQHPRAEIIVQSILPHAGDQATWEGRDRLLRIPNTVIREVNDQLQAIAEQEKVEYLDLYPLFADPSGHLMPQLTTDGLHLSEQGYWVWRSALQSYNLSRR
ncbi:MAG: G-D-S-L family lipolytic protein [Leptolyngbya sp. DLM2.Bin15]|nr:MAG: G-D-S-L family lipolytic protein [Leptolyngbya sp. DLM2.Bin15]